MVIILLLVLIVALGFAGLGDHSTPVEAPDTARVPTEPAATDGEPQSIPEERVNDDTTEGISPEEAAIPRHGPLTPEQKEIASRIDSAKYMREITITCVPKLIGPFSENALLIQIGDGDPPFAVIKSTEWSDPSTLLAGDVLEITIATMAKQLENGRLEAAFHDGFRLAEIRTVVRDGKTIFTSHIGTPGPPRVKER